MKRDCEFILKRKKKHTHTGKRVRNENWTTEEMRHNLVFGSFGLFGSRKLDDGQGKLSGFVFYTGF